MVFVLMLGCRRLGCEVLGGRFVEGGRWRGGGAEKRSGQWRIGTSLSLDQ